MRALALKRSKQGLEEAMRVILSNMMGHVQLRAILDKIVQEHGADEFGDFRWILSGALPLSSEARPTPGAHHHPSWPCVRACVRASCVRVCRRSHDGPVLV